MNHHPFQILLIIILLVQSCFRVEQKEGDVLTVKPLAVTQEVKELSPFISEMETIPLVMDQVRFSGMKKMLVSDSCYYVLSNAKVFVVSWDGSEISQLGLIGEGPDEYVHITDICFNHEHSELWCLDAANSILRFDLSSGEILQKLELGAEYINAIAIFPSKDNLISLYIPNPVDLKGASLFFCIRLLDFDGNEKGRSMLWDDLHLSAVFCSPVSCSADDRYVLSPGFSNNCLMFTDGEESTLEFDFGVKDIPNRYAFESCEDPWTKLGEIFAADYFKAVSSVFFVEGGLYFSAFGKNSSLWNFYVSKDLKTGIRWESKGMTHPPSPAVSCSKDCLYFYIEDPASLSEEENSDPIERYVQEATGHLNQGCPLLVKVLLSWR